MSIKSFVFVVFFYFAAVAEVSGFRNSGPSTFPWNHGNGHRGNVQNSPPSQPQCVTPQGPCACQTNEGLVDLSPIDSKDGSKPHFDKVHSSSGSTIFMYNPCTPINTDACRNAAICLCYSQWYCFAVGVHSSAQFKTDAATKKLTITYTAGGFYESVVTLTCDKTQEGTLTVDSPNNPYKFTLTSKYACPLDSGEVGSGEGDKQLG